MERRRVEKRSMQSEEKPAQLPSEELVKAICKWVRLFGEHFRAEVSEASMVAYIEGLKDLRIGQIKFCCERTLKEATRMPTVADIRQRIYIENPGNRPEYLDEEPLSEEDRNAALEFSQKLREAIVRMEEREKKREIITCEISPYFPAYHEAYLAWLTEQAELDERIRMEGGSPLPRTEEERLAIFYNLPLAERKRLKRKAEWTKLAIKNT